MIRNKIDLYTYLSQDKKALGISRKKPKFFTDHIWKYQILLRKCEYYKNTKKGLFGQAIYYTYFLKFYKLGIKLNYTIPLNVVGPGLAIVHIGDIVISNDAKIGSNCRIHVGVNIGAQAGIPENVPIIGNDVYIGPGVKIFGKVTIGNNVAIGANSVVLKDVPSDVSIAGVPAKIINNMGRLNRDRPF